MKITPLNNTTSFSGYLDKSVYKYVNSAATNSKNNFNAFASKVSDTQLNATLKKVDETRDSILMTLEKFISSCHAKTFLKISNGPDTPPNLYLDNKSLKLKYPIPAVSLILFALKIGANEIIEPLRRHGSNISSSELYKRLGDSDLKQLKIFCDEIDKIESEQADELILKSYKKQSSHKSKNIFELISQKCKQKKIDKFSKEIS